MEMEATESFALLQEMHRSQGTLEKQLAQIQESLLKLIAKSPPRSSPEKSARFPIASCEEAYRTKMLSGPPADATIVSASQVDLKVDVEEYAIGSQKSWADAIRRLKDSPSCNDLTADDEENVKAQGNSKVLTIAEQSQESIESGSDSQSFMKMVSSRSKGSGIKAFRPTSKLQALVVSSLFTHASSFAILCNAIVIGCEVDYRSMHSDPSAFYTTMQYTFFFIFAIELALRALAYKQHFFFGSDAWWNFFDVAMVCLSVFEVLDTIIVSNIANRQIRRVFSIFRMFRVIRVFRVLRFSPQLRVMVFMILESVKSLGWLVCLLASFLYVFSIIFTTGSTEYLGVPGSEEYQPNRKYAKQFEKNYATVLKSLYSCFRSMTNGQAWGELMDPLLDMDMGWFYASFFILFILFAVLCFLNVVTGVFVDGALEKSKQDREVVIEKELNLKKAYVQSLHSIFDETDKDGSGTISQDEFEEYLKDERVQAYFSSLRIDVSDIGSLFKLLDQNGNGEIDLKEFIENLMQLRAQTPDQTMQTLLIETRKATRKLERCFEYVGSMVDDLNGNLKTLPTVTSQLLSNMNLSLRPAYQDCGSLLLI